MRFQTKLLLTYSALIFLLVVTMAIGFFLYSSRLFEENAQATYRLIADKMTEQFENQFRSMEFLETNLVSDAGFKSALETLARLDRRDPLNRIEIHKAEVVLRSSLYNYAAIKSFYAVNVYNTQGDFFSSNFLHHQNVPRVTETIAALPWAPMAIELSGKRLLVPPSLDPWVKESPPKVFGLVRYMPGSWNDLGFIEVQNDYAILERIFDVPDPEFARVAAWTEAQALFYQSGPLGRAELDAYRKAGNNRDRPDPTKFERHPATGRDELLLVRKGGESGLTVVVALDRDILVRPLWVTAGLTAWFGLILLAVSVAFSWYSSRHLTQPLRLIQKRMEDTVLENLPQSHPFDHPNDEITALNSAFEGLKERLDAAIRQEIRSRTWGVQAQLDSLQAQVNPHFLYNILTVLAAKGLEVGAPEIGEICGGIASMLRYSTDTSARTASLEEEVRHVEIYLGLMKTRFEERLTYTIDVEPAILDAAVPKIVLQQIVENSVNHGFKTTAGPMAVSVRGWREADRWVVEVADNGQGFTPEVLNRERSALDDVARRLETGVGGEGLSFGGLGLRNTFGRLHLFFQGKVAWSMENAAEGGAVVRISAPLRLGREGS